jgi:hypothetical protein
VCAELLQSVSRGDHPELTPKLRALVDERLQDVRWTSALAQPTAAPLLHSVAQFDPLGSALARPRVRVLRTQCDGVATTVTAA